MELFRKTNVDKAGQIQSPKGELKMKKTLLCTAIIFVLLFAGCGKANEPVTLPMPEENARPVVGPEETPADAAGDDGAVIDVYLSDDAAEHFVVRQEKAETVDENTVFAALKAAGVIPEETKLLSFANNGGALTLDMSGEFAAYVNTMGTSGEYMVLGSVVNTYLTAFGADTLTLLSDGAPLETGHNVYDQPLSFYKDNA